MPTLDLASPSPVPLLLVADLRDAGARPHRDGELVRVRSGVYAPRRAFDALAPSDRYLARVHAFALRHPDAVLCGPSARAVRGWPSLGRPRDIHVFDALRAASRRFGDIVVHTSRDVPTIETVGGLWVTGVAETMVDGVRSLAPAAGVALADAVARRYGPEILATAADLAASQAATRGRAKLRLVLSLADPLAESVGESASRVVIRWLGFETPVLQAEFPWDGGVDRVDHWWPAVAAIGEFDGYGKYTIDASATAAQRVIAEKQREDRLRRRCRAFDRWDWDDVLAIRPLESRLLAMRVPRPHAPHTALLAGLRRDAF